MNVNRIRDWIEEKRTAKRRADLERLAAVVEDEYELAQIEADVLARQFDPEMPLVQCALKLRDSFAVWHEKYRDVLAAYDEFQFEKARYETSRHTAILSGSVLRKELGRRSTKALFLD
jgi:hypothetical protein